VRQHALQPKFGDVLIPDGYRRGAGQGTETIDDQEVLPRILFVQMELDSGGRSTCQEHPEDHRIPGWNEIRQPVKETEIQNLHVR